MEMYEAAYLAGIIDGEGSIMLTRMHKGENRRPCITISSSDMELLMYIQKITNGRIYSKKNYQPSKHKNSYTLVIKKKNEVFHILKEVHPFLKIAQKSKRAKWILDHYHSVTPRNGKYTAKMLKQKLQFENIFFKL